MYKLTDDHKRTQPGIYNRPLASTELALLALLGRRGVVWGALRLHRIPDQRRASCRLRSLGARDPIVGALHALQLLGVLAGFKVNPLALAQVYARPLRALLLCPSTPILRSSGLPHACPVT